MFWSITVNILNRRLLSRISWIKGISAARIKKGTSVIEKAGGRMKTIYSVPGNFDLVLLADFPGDYCFGVSLLDGKPLVCYSKSLSSAVMVVSNPSIFLNVVAFRAADPPWQLLKKM